ncbi:hypothetical protein K2X30_13865 [bacterium]|jgi:hypothetical protein|nr:hypothetical protein [bacterium]
MMKTFSMVLTALISISASAAEFQVNPVHAQGLFRSLVDSGATPRGPARQMQSVTVTRLQCSGNYRPGKTTADCAFTDGAKNVNVSGDKAAQLFTVLIQAGLIQAGPAGLSAGSINLLQCSYSDFDGLATYNCTVDN